MIRTVVQIDGMMCGMCESHINDAIRRSFAVKKVVSSHKKGTTEIRSESPLDEEELKAAIEKTGYRVMAVSSAPCEEHGLFRWRKGM